MKILLVDISGKVPLYDATLFNSLVSEKSDKDEILLLTPYQSLNSHGKNIFKLFSFANKIKSKRTAFVKIFKAIQCLLNYFKLVFIVHRLKPNVLHFQWLPFIELNSIEKVFLKIYRIISPNTKLLLTIHNVYPHDIGYDGKVQYNKRFSSITKLFDGFIVHTQTSKEDVVCEFNLNLEHIYVCCHGVFEPQNIAIKKLLRENGKLHILQFGVQSSYKGTDLLVKAINQLDEKHRNNVEVRIVGSISPSYLQKLRELDKSSSIFWKPYLLEEDELHNEINNSDLIILPYRAISQSGVLLLSIFFEKLIICSDLPSFKETMHGVNNVDLDADLFFKSENVDSLTNLLIRYIVGSVNENQIHERVKCLKALYSWINAAKSTLQVYSLLVNKN